MEPSGPGGDGEAAGPPDDGQVADPGRGPEEDVPCLAFRFRTGLGSVPDSTVKAFLGFVLERCPRPDSAGTRAWVADLGDAFEQLGHAEKERLARLTRGLFHLKRDEGLKRDLFDLSPARLECLFHVNCQSPEGGISRLQNSPCLQVHV